MSTEREQAGRCIALIRPHQWTYWRYSERKLVVMGVVSIQTRECLRCGKTQMASVGAP